MIKTESIVNWIGHVCNYTVTYEIITRKINRVTGYVSKTEDLV